MYSQIILVGVLPLVRCLGSSGLSSPITAPIYFATSSQTQSSSIIITTTTSIVARSSSSVFSSGLSSLYSISNDPLATSTIPMIGTSTFTFPTATTSPTVVTSVDSSSATSSSACPTLVARNDDDDDDATLLAAMAYWEFLFNNTNYFSLDDTISQALQLANSTDGYDPDVPTTDPPQTNPDTPPIDPNSPIIPDSCPLILPKKRHRNAAERFLDWLKKHTGLGLGLHWKWRFEDKNLSAILPDVSTKERGGSKGGPRCLTLSKKFDNK